nr:MAG TPA: hypothetical protein [Caudoviricetes sp.]
MCKYDLTGIAILFLLAVLLLLVVGITGAALGIASALLP